MLYERHASLHFIPRLPERLSTTWQASNRLPAIPDTIPGQGTSFHADGVHHSPGNLGKHCLAVATVTGATSSGLTQDQGSVAWESPWRSVAESASEALGSAGISGTAGVRGGSVSYDVLCNCSISFKNSLHSCMTFSFCVSSNARFKSFLHSSSDSFVSCSAISRNLAAPRT